MDLNDSRKVLFTIACVAMLAVAVWYITDDESLAPANPKAIEIAGAIKEAIPAEPESSVGSHVAKAILVPLEAVADADILLDVSENSSTHIPGSVVIPYTKFDVRPGVVKSAAEISKILGDAGISRQDSVLLYGECLPCGGGPSAATYVYWIMKSLGHERVMVLSGTAEDWAAAGRPTVRVSEVLPGKIYEPTETADFTATYDYVKSGRGQIMDARTPKEFEHGSIPGSISIPYDIVLDGKKLKSKDQLNEAFKDLKKDRTVVVFTQTGMKGSVVWFALEMLGYDVKLYSYRDWLEHQEIMGGASN